MAIRPRGNRWLVDIYDQHGKRHRHSFPTRPEALAWEGAAKLAAIEGKPFPLVPSFLKKNPHMTRMDTLRGLFNYQVRVDWGNARASPTLIKNGKDVVAYFGEQCSPKAINRAAIEGFKAHFAAKGAAKATINRKLSALSKLLKVARDFELMDKVPAIKWEREEKTKFRYLERQEEARILGYFGQTDDENKRLMSNFCVFLLDTGARMSELFGLKFNSFSQDGASVTFWQTKTDKPRTVPLTKRCQKLLIRDTPFMAWLEAKTNNQTHSDPGSRHNMTKGLFRKLWRHMQKDLGWEDVTPHTIRHTCCTRLVSRGVDIKRVMEWMGHTNIDTTLRYMQISPQGLQDVVGVLEGDKPLLETNNNEIMPEAA